MRESKTERRLELVIGSSKNKPMLANVEQLQKLLDDHTVVIKDGEVVLTASKETLMMREELGDDEAECLPPPTEQNRGYGPQLRKKWSKGK